jgi:hypothetical protein
MKFERIAGPKRPDHGSGEFPRKKVSRLFGPAFRVLCFAAVFCALPCLLPAQTPDNLPEIVRVTTELPDFVIVLPSRSDTLYGYGAALGATVDESAEVAGNHARKDLAGKMVEGIPAVSEYIRQVSGGRWDSGFVQFLLLANRHLMDALTYTGVTTVERRVQTPDGVVWYLMSLKKQDAIRIIDNVDRLLR